MKKLSIILIMFLFPLIASANIFQAVKDGDLTKTLIILKTTGNVDMRDENGWTPLMYAARLGHTKIAEELLSRGANIEAENNAGITPFLWACYAGHLDMVKFLLQHDANEFQLSVTNEGALQIAESMGQKTIFDYLIENVYTSDNPPSEKEMEIFISQTNPSIAFQKAIKNDDVEAFQKAITRFYGIDLNKELIHHYTPLMYAAISGSYRVARELVKLDEVDINQIGGEFNTTALILAVAHDEPNVVKALLTRKDLDLNHTDNKGRNAIQMAKHSPNPKMKNAFKTFFQKHKK